MWGFSRRVWLIVESSGCESKCGELDSKGWGEFPGRESLRLDCELDGEANAIEEGSRSHGREGTGGCGLEDAVDRALNGTGIGKGTEADGGGPARLLPPLLTLVGEAKRVTGESDGAAGCSVGFGMRAEPGAH
jgi:hypothetical protein